MRIRLLAFVAISVLLVTGVAAHAGGARAQDVPIADPAFWTGSTPTGEASVVNVLTKPLVGGDGASISDSFGGYAEPPAWMRPYLTPLIEDTGTGLLPSITTWLPRVTLGGLAVTGAIVIANKYWLHLDLGLLGTFNANAPNYPRMAGVFYQYYANGPNVEATTQGWYLYDATSGGDGPLAENCWMYYQMCSWAPYYMGPEQQQAWNVFGDPSRPSTLLDYTWSNPPQGPNVHRYKYIPRVAFPSYVLPDSALQLWTGTGPQANVPVLAHVPWGPGVIIDSNGDPYSIPSSKITQGIGLATSDPAAVQNWLNCQINQLRWACPDPSGDSVPNGEGTGSGGRGGYTGDGSGSSGAGDQACDFTNNSPITWATAASSDPPFYADACAQAWAAATAAGLLAPDGTPAAWAVAGAEVVIPGIYLADPEVRDALEQISGPDWAQHWAKVAIGPFQTAHGLAKIHFYKNLDTQATWLGKGFKVIFADPF